MCINHIQGHNLVAVFSCKSCDPATAQNTKSCGKVAVIFAKVAVKLRCFLQKLRQSCGYFWKNAAVFAKVEVVQIYVVVKSSHLDNNFIVLIIKRVILILRLLPRSTITVSSQKFTLSPQRLNGIT